MELLDPPRLDDRLARVERLVSSHLDVVLDGDFDDRNAKAACEIALLAALIVDRALGGVHGAWAVDTLARLAPRIAGESIVQRLLWTPSRAGMFAIGIGLLARCGWHDAGRRELVAGLLRPEFAATYEASPYQLVEQAWCAHLLELEPPVAPVQQAFARGVEPLFMTEADAYAYTHAIFYSTDFGARPLDGDLVRVAAEIDAGTLWSLVRRDFDLLGEWLLCAVLVVDRPSAAVRLGLRAWAAVWDERGEVPDRAAPIAADVSRSDAFFGRYHANLVGGLLATSLLARSTWRADAVATPIANPALAARLEVEVAAAIGAILAPIALAGESSSSLLGELLIQRGMYDRELAAVLTGIRVGAPTPSITWRAAIRWATAFQRGVTALGLLDGDGAADVRAALAEAIELGAT